MFLKRELDKIDPALGNFYENLSAAQKPLGEEFEKVLHDNLWELYET